MRRASAEQGAERQHEQAEVRVGNIFRPATVVVATNSTMAPTDKSMLPIRMTKLAPSEAISKVAASPVVAAKLRQVKNAGDVNEKMTTRVRNTATGSHVPRS